MTDSAIDGGRYLYPDAIVELRAKLTADRDDLTARLSEIQQRVKTLTSDLHRVNGALWACDDLEAKLKAGVKQRLQKHYRCDPENIIDVSNPD